MRSALRALYDKLKLDYLQADAAIIPKRHWSQFINLGGASEFQFHLGQIVPKEKRRVLIIGLSGGRDYFYFKLRGHEVWGLDLFSDPEVPVEHMIVGNIEDETILPKNFFDAVIFCAVIEHLSEDYKALKNIRAALKDDGILALNTIYFGDVEETHIQLYSPKTLRRLLAAAGFKIEQEIENPSLFWFPQITNRIHHMINAIWYVLFKRTLYKYTLPFLWKADYFFATKKFFLRKHMFNRWVVTLKCVKAEEFDYLGVNRERFRD